MSRNFKKRNVFFVYVLYSSKFDKFYVGQTNNIEDRLKRHIRGYVKSTKLFIPYELVWKCEKETRAEAIKLERKLKNLRSKTRLKKFIEKYS